MTHRTCNSPEHADLRGTRTLCKAEKLIFQSRSRNLSRDTNHASSTRIYYPPYSSRWPITARIHQCPTSEPPRNLVGLSRENLRTVDAVYRKKGPDPLLSIR